MESPLDSRPDQIAIAIAEIGAIAQRRISLLVDPAMSFGLPAFLSPDPGLNSGLMVVEIASAALASENKALSNPRVVDSTPTSANQEDHVAMSCHAARRLLEMNANLSRIVGIEAICSAQGVDLRAPLITGPALARMHSRIRESITPLGQDRILSNDMETAAELVRDGILVPSESPELEVLP